MGKLINIINERHNLDLYFEKIYITDSGANQTAHIQVRYNYPYLLALHAEQKHLLFQIRKIIERRCNGDVVMIWFNLDYRIPLDPKNIYSNLELICHRYYAFYFELQSDAALVKLSINAPLEPTIWHPNQFDYHEQLVAQFEMENHKHQTPYATKLRSNALEKFKKMTVDNMEYSIKLQQ